MKAKDFFKMTYQRAVTNIVVLILMFWIGAASAISGVELASKTDASQEVEDMRVKVLGGYIRITRQWDYPSASWVWNKRWEKVTLDSELTIHRSSVYKYTHYDSAQIFYENRSGDFFVRQSWIGHEGASNDLTWNDRVGNKITYSKGLYGLFQPKDYKNNSDVTVHFERGDGDQITEIKDHFGQVIISYEWLKTDKAYKLVSITDYTGRKVSYVYDGQKLKSVTDVNGQQWKYNYEFSDNRNIVRELEDPEGRIFKQVLSNDPGVIGAPKYDAKTALTYQSETDGAGRFVETWKNDLGEITSKKVNGQIELSREFILSDATATIDSVHRKYQRPDDAAKQTDEFCKLMGGVVAWWQFDSNTSGCATKRTFGMQREICGTGPYSVCNPNERYELAAELDISNPIVLHNPDPANPIPYVKKMIETDGKGLKTTHEYDNQKNEIKVTYPDGTFITRTWHPKYAFPLTVTNQRGIVTAYDYDEKGNLLTLTEAKGTADQRITRYTYDQYGQLKTETTGESAANNTTLAQTSYEYDTYGNPTKVTDPEGNVTTYSDHDVLGNAKTIKDARANKLAPAAQYSWKFTYDLVGNMLTSQNPYGKGFTFSYNKTGDIQTTLGVDGSPATYTTNAAGAPLTVTDANGKVMKFEYDAIGNLVAITDANGNKSQRVFDANGAISKLVDGENNVTQFNYQQNQLKSIQFPTYKQLLDYDSTGQTTQVTQQANGKNYVRKRNYNKTGNITGLVDANNNSISYEYDSIGRVVKMINANSGVIEFTYDARDNLLQVKDAENRLTIYTYDKNDNLLTETKDGNQNTSKQYRYTYDENENVASFINPEQEKTTYEYDRADRLIKKSVFAHKDHSLPVKVVDYAVNDKDQLTGWDQKVPASLQEGVQQTADTIPLSETYTYTSHGQPESVTTNFGSFSKSFSYSYYPNGLQKTYTNPEGVVYTYYYNRNNQLVAVHIPNVGQISYGDFSWLKPKTIVLPGGTRVGSTLTDFMQTKDRTLKNAAQATISNAHYEYDLENNITQLNQDGSAANFSYDNLYRLKTVDMPESSAANDEAFDYDGVGNRTFYALGTNPGTALTYNNKNQLTNSDGASYTYTTNGHTQTVTRNGVVTEYIYNHEERLIAVKRAGDVVAEYAYNPQGQRVKKTVNGVVTWFLYTGNGLAAEYASNGQLIKEYHFHPQKDWMTDPLFVRNAQNEIYYYYNDHLGTPLQLISNTGQIVWQAQYDAFGYAHILTNTVENNLRLPGQYFDVETGLHYNYFRDYDPSIGRYIESDPVGLYGGSNTYAYLEGNPMMGIDPLGLWVWGDPLPQDLVDGAAGFGDGLSGGLTDWMRDQMGTNESVNKCSSSYSNSHTTGAGSALGLGVGRLVYAGVAKGYSMTASSGTAASAFRSQLRVYFGGGKSLRPPNLSKYPTDDLLREAAGRTNPYANAMGAAAAGMGANSLAGNNGCGCSQ